MKRYFITFLLVVLCVTGVVLASPLTFAAPGGFICDPCVDTNGDSLCDQCGKQVNGPAPDEEPTEAPTEGVSDDPVFSEITVNWCDYKISFDASECPTWGELANTGDAGYKGLLIDSKNRVCYQLDLEETVYYICDASGNIQYADDVITDTTYTFSAFCAAFGTDFVYCEDLFAPYCFWFDLVSDPLDGLDAYFFTEDDGSISFYCSAYGCSFEVFDAAGNRVNENDVVALTRYTLLCDFTFTIKECGTSGSTGVVHTLSARVSTFSLSALASSEVVFTSDTLGNCVFVSSGNGPVVLGVGFDGEGNYASLHYLFDDNGLIDFLARECCYSENPCLFGYHRFDTEVLRQAQTCTADGFIRYKCFNCTEYKDTILPAYGHRFADVYTVITEPTCIELGTEGRQCRRCGCYGYERSVPALGHNFNLLGRCKRDGCNAVSESASAVGGWFSGIGDSIAKGAGNLWAKAKDTFDKGKDAVGDKVSSFAATVAVVAGLAIGIPVAILVVRLINKLKKKK